MFCGLKISPHCCCGLCNRPDLPTQFIKFLLIIKWLTLASSPVPLFSHAAVKKKEGPGTQFAHASKSPASLLSSHDE